MRLKFKLFEVNRHVRFGSFGVAFIMECDASYCSDESVRNYIILLTVTCSDQRSIQPVKVTMWDEQNTTWRVPSLLHESLSDRAFVLVRSPACVHASSCRRLLGSCHLE